LTLQLEKVHAFYGLSHILQGIDMEVPERSIVALMGRNGVGKSTTLKSIMGLLRRVEGNILFENKNIGGLPSFKISRLGLSYVPEDRRIFPKLTVLQNLRLGMSNLNTREKEYESKHLEMVFGYFPILENRIAQEGGSLSGGEQQQLAIARALMGKTKLMLLDEPSEGLAPIIVELIKNIIVRIRENGISILLVEQNAMLALKVCDHCYVMEKGTTIFNGTAKELLDSNEIKEKLCV